MLRYQIDYELFKQETAENGMTGLQSTFQTFNAKVNHA